MIERVGLGAARPSGSSGRGDDGGWRRRGDGGRRRLHGGGAARRGVSKQVDGGVEVHTFHVTPAAGPHVSVPAGRMREPLAAGRARADAARAAEVAR